MSYTPTNWNTGDTITASALNKLENGVANAGGNEYDIIIEAGSEFSNNIANYSIIKFDVEEVARKISANEIVSGVCFAHYNYDVNIDGDTDVVFCPLTYIGVWSNLGIMRFDSFRMETANNIRFRQVGLSFDPSTGSLEGMDNFYNITKTIS